MHSRAGELCRISDILKNVPNKHSARRRKQTQANYGDGPRRRHWGFGILLGGLLLFAVIAFIIAAAFHPYYNPTMMPYYGGWFFFPFGFFFFFIIIFAVGKLIFWPWGWRRGYWYHYDDAAEILRQRYARGEITKDQFAQMMRDLEQHG